MSTEGVGENRTSSLWWLLRLYQSPLTDIRTGGLWLPSKSGEDIWPQIFEELSTCSSRALTNGYVLRPLPRDRFCAKSPDENGSNEGRLVEALVHFSSFPCLLHVMNRDCLVKDIN